MFYRCPQCHEIFASEATEVTHCAYCNAWLKISMLETTPQPSPAAKTEAPPVNEQSALAPWEQTSPGMVKRFVLTLRQVLRHAPQFFFRLAPSSSKSAERYAYIVSLIGLLGYFATQTWMFSHPQIELQNMLHDMAERLGGHVPDVAMIARFMRVLTLATPLLALFPVHIAAGLYHLGLMFSGVETRGYEYTFRVAAYGLTPIIFLAVPGFGMIIAPGWIFALHWIGLSGVHRIPLSTAALAMMIPSLFFVLLSTGFVGELILLWLGNAH